YKDWCPKTGFTSKLPNAIKQAKLAQTSVLTTHFGPAPSKAMEAAVAPYMDELFLQLAIEWMIVTNQGSSLSSMLEMASRAKYKLKVPGPKVTCNKILELFQGHLRDLKKQFTVSI
ncbi:hypothetical protein JB92DRAFT_2595201, partial [Gautieria morchelliformis]